MSFAGDRARWPLDLKSQISNLRSLAESCSRQLRGWANTLQNSPIQGRRHLTDRSREIEEQQKRALACRKELLRRLPANHPLRKDAERRGLI